MAARTMRILSALLLFLFSVFVLSSKCHAHGFMETPRQRGILERNPFTNTWPFLTNLPPETYDYKCHFPAGDKADWPGAGVESQKIQGARTGWTPYEPWNPHFEFRSGVCGDPKWNLEHMRNGRFYYPRGNPHIVASYEQAGIVDITATVVIWHMGFFEFTLCDVFKCGGEISEECLRDPNICPRLIREPVPECESKTSINCAPIDPRNPTRWYVPCPYPSYESVMTWGHGTIKYKIPDNLHCEHCVLQWYWVSATECNPPGVQNYFRGPRGPNWNHCPNFGGNHTGFGDWEPCGNHFPEEYYQCADVRVSPIIQGLKIYSNGGVLDEVRDGRQKWLFVGRRPVQLEVHVGEHEFRKVSFFVTERDEWISTSKPYVYLGTTEGHFNTWLDPIMDRWFTVSIVAEFYDGRQFRFYCQLFFASS